MPIDWNQLNINARVLVEIALTGATLRFSDGNDQTIDFGGSNGRYDNRAKVSVLNTAFGSLTDPRQRDSSLEIKLNNKDGALDAYRSYWWINRVVTIKLGAGNVYSNYATEFVGIVRSPNGVDWNDKDDEITVHINDRRSTELTGDGALLPTNLFNTTAFPNLEAGAAGKPIPILYGDFTGSGTTAKIGPVTCVNTSSDPRQFKICSNALRSINAAYKRSKGSRQAWTAVGMAATDLTAGTTNWNLTVTAANFNPDTEELAVECAGVNDGSSNLMENASDIILDLLTAHMGLVAGTDTNTAQFAAFKADVSEFRCRRWMNTRKTAAVWISEMLNEIGGESSVRAGLYYPTFFIPLYDSSATLYESFDLMEAGFPAQDDPESVYANHIDARYDENVPDENFHKTYSYESSAAITNAGATIRKAWDFFWLWRPTDIQTRCQRYVLLFGANIPEIIRPTFRSKAMQEYIANTIRFSAGRFTAASMRLRRVAKDLNRMQSVAIEMLNVSSLATLGRWTAPDAPNYASATAEQRQEQGFWTNADGEASPGDPDSKYSHWW